MSSAACPRIEKRIFGDFLGKTKKLLRRRAELPASALKQKSKKQKAKSKNKNKNKKRANCCQLTRFINIRLQLASSGR